MKKIFLVALVFIGQFLFLSNLNAEPICESIFKHYVTVEEKGGQKTYSYNNTQYDSLDKLKGALKENHEKNVGKLIFETIQNGKFYSVETEGVNNSRCYLSQTEDLIGYLILFEKTNNTKILEYVSRLLFSTYFDPSVLRYLTSQTAEIIEQHEALTDDQRFILMATFDVLFAAEHFELGNIGNESTRKSLLEHIIDPLKLVDNIFADNTLTVTDKTDELSILWQIVDTLDGTHYKKEVASEKSIQIGLRLLSNLNKSGLVVEDDLATGGNPFTGPFVKIEGTSKLLETLDTIFYSRLKASKTPDLFTSILNTLDKLNSDNNATLSRIIENLVMRIATPYSQIEGTEEKTKYTELIITSLPHLRINACKVNLIGALGSLYPESEKALPLLEKMLADEKTSQEIRDQISKVQKQMKNGGDPF